MEVVELYDDTLCQSCGSSNDAACRGKGEVAFVVVLLYVRRLDDKPVHVAIEAVAQPLCHVSEVGVLVFYLTHVDMVAEVLVG